MHRAHIFNSSTGNQAGDSRRENMKNFIEDCSELIPELLETACFLSILIVGVIGAFLILTDRINFGVY